MVTQRAAYGCIAGDFLVPAATALLDITTAPSFSKSTGAGGFGADSLGSEGGRGGEATGANDFLGVGNDRSDLLAPGSGAWLGDVGSDGAFWWGYEDDTRARLAAAAAEAARGSLPQALLSAEEECALRSAARALGGDPGDGTWGGKGGGGGTKGSDKEALERGLSFVEWVRHPHEEVLPRPGSAKGRAGAGSEGRTYEDHRHREGVARAAVVGAAAAAAADLAWGASEAAIGRNALLSPTYEAAMAEGLLGIGWTRVALRLSPPVTLQVLWLLERIASGR